MCNEYSPTAASQNGASDQLPVRILKIHTVFEQDLDQFVPEIHVGLPQHLFNLGIPDGKGAFRIKVNLVDGPPR